MPPCSSLGHCGANLARECYNAETEAQLDELTYQPIREPDFEPAAGIILESLRRREAS